MPAGAALALLLCVKAMSAAAEYVPNEVQASPQLTLVDPEFNQARAQMVWSDYNGDIWVAGVERATGNLIPSNGKGYRIDRQAATLFDGLGVLTGPEWAWGADTDYVVYTKFVAGMERVLANARLAVARPNADGSWALSTLLSNLPRHSPLGSETKGDPALRINYFDDQGYQYWCEISRPETEEMLPSALPQPARAVRGARALVYLIEVEGLAQVFHYNINNTGQLEQLTFEAEAKLSPRIWKAPEFGNQLVLATVTNRKTIRFYRKQTDDTGASAWLPFHEATDPSIHNLVSIEPFVYAGRSYVVMGNAKTALSGANSIWVANLDATNPIFRRITPESPARLRTDPEVFITKQGPVIYFNRFNPSAAPQSEGLYRSDPGLAP